MRKQGALVVLNLVLSSGLVLPGVLAAEPATSVEKAKGQYAISAAVPNSRRDLIKFGRYFMLLDESGQAPPDNPFGYGLYTDDTRYLDTWAFSLDGQPLTMLSHNTDEGYAGRYIYSNQAIKEGPDAIQDQRLLIERDVVADDGLHERWKITNYDTAERTFNLSIKYGADFADMFEIRGQQRKRRGDLLATVVDEKGSNALLSYRGLDGRLMSTRVQFNLKPNQLTAGEATFNVTLPPKKEWWLETDVITELQPLPGDVAAASKGAVADTEHDQFVQRKTSLDTRYHVWRAGGALISSDNNSFNQLCERSFRDLFILRQPTPRGMCVAAGVPWFAVAFGRDQEVVGMETLGFQPSLAKDVIELLSQYQGSKDDPFTEEHAGRIMHELRLGEMARLKEIPFIPYYGTVDATPLWLVLISDYVAWTGDLEMAKRHWPAIESALTYLDTQRRNGYLSYGGVPGAALSNQGWKDSGDSVMYSDGTLAHPPIALCEPQGYLYYAWVSLAAIARKLGKNEKADQLEQQAAELKKRFQQDFWNDKLQYVALALDGQGKQCDVVSSNPAHLLWTGILSPTQAGLVARKLLSEEMFAGWGIRTLSAHQTSYDPLSYHDGSIWPHDNAIAARGLCAIGETGSAAVVMDGIYKVALHQPDLRLPELFCGFSTRYSEQPIWYPVSCTPQAWAAGSVFLLLRSALGLVPDAQNQTLHVVHPTLPEFLQSLDIRGLRVGGGTVELQFKRSHNATVCQVVSAKGVKVEVSCSGVAESPAAPEPRLLR